MDLGLKGKTAIVCASSKGLGKACAMALAQEGVNLVINGRSPGPLEVTAEEIQKATGVQVTPIACDITSDEGRAAVLDACSTPDILVNNAGGPPPGDFRDWDKEAWHAAIDANMLTPIFLIKSVIDHMIDQRFGRIVNITSSAVKAPISILGLSNGARSGLTGFVAGLARDVVQHNVTINGLLPGPFETDRLSSNIAAAAAKKGISAEDEATSRLTSHPARRFGDPDEFGATCAFLCGDKSGYINGQNILIDGGGFPGTL
ncbi:SDR family oxidoreductase [Aestuariispira ectoiniformans]|uniref:SDR family oxidoreductase n=1 Tax=Aestuariispira ectoiniformans TaxID=2775080 RepID=UPI00223BC87A|nr:SDR family oxidoreductase [Aestuariispira ectoiniformans]